MPAADFQYSEPGTDDGRPPVQCEACRSAFESDSRQAVSFLLVDQLTIPLVSCEDHLEQFASVCGLTTEDAAETLDHRPAGGVRCPGCQHAPHSGTQPVIPVREGAVLVVACPEHQSKILQRFQAGIQTRRTLSSSVDAATPSLR
ncbi:hypothetical protein [Halostagnicola kamekurae]|uniref:Uncharacterized protein n=1 Tax=Halostagnicola kamekurae TaxID=619731 RepID=A0A1I6SQ81_9EURY|nr:hypothetical protein [Halostagnicola kamekurae]SFS79081.1 hypothetical protein SAMN04488556_2840 [Halostagnicola kamekurae]